MRFLFVILLSIALAGHAVGRENQAAPYAGSSSCRECHERFYQLWSTSMHGLAMQPYSAVFAREKLTPYEGEITIGTDSYRADVAEGFVIETNEKGAEKYRIAHVLGGKNIYYFLTPLAKGRLQTLPLAYDVNQKEWFDTAASHMRHFPGGERSETVQWKASVYTFNTACYSCHVSQLSTNYDLENDTYHTTWAEPGINCETCHGPSAEHNRIARKHQNEAPKGAPLSDPKIISTKTMTKAQRNDLCLSCHAKANPLTPEFMPGERFYDHFDLVTLEDPDYYPDGRDLGENYTMTSWRMSPCVKSGQIDCMHCHTSSGRYRFKNEKFNDACMPCHADKVKDPVAHTHHPAESESSRCISCHMPMTAFARMNRSDHSMLPPTPAATMAYQSPNACNVCHTDKDEAWADSFVRQWRTRDFQAPILKRAGLIDAARKRDWARLPDMLDYISDPNHDEIFAASLIRLIPPAQDPKVLAALIAAAEDPSPLVRGAAVRTMGMIPAMESAQALILAAGDDSRLVRIRAAEGIAAFPDMAVPPAYQAPLKKANKEYVTSITARPDQWMSHYNLGNTLLGLGELKDAAASYQTALRLNPQAIMAMVNASIAYARMGETGKAEQSLAAALLQDPDNSAANLNMGLLKAENNDLKAAEKHFKAAFAADPHMAQAAYNLCIITAKDRIDEAVAWCRKASNLAPQEPRYAYTLAFYLNQEGHKDEAATILKGLVEKYPQYKDAEMLLKQISM